MILNHQYFELIADYLNKVECKYQDNQKTLRNAAAENHVMLRVFYHFLPEESDRLGCHADVI